jgi:hypothetical protein
LFLVTQLYQKWRTFAIIPAVLLPYSIEFSRCIGTFTSAKFKFIK